MHMASLNRGLSRSTDSMDGRRAPAAVTSLPMKATNGRGSRDLEMRDNSSYLKQDDAEEDHGDKGKDKKDKFSILEYVIGTTGFQGPEKIRESPYKLLKVLWLLAFVAGIVLTIVHLVQLTLEFEEFRVKTDVNLKFSPLPLPALTVCNVNPVRLHQARLMSCGIQQVLQIPDDLKRQDCRGASESDYLDFSDLNDFQLNEYGGEIGSNFASQGLDEFFIRQELINYLMADEPRQRRVQAGHQGQDMIMKCTLFGRPCSFQNARPFLSRDYGNCFTFSAPTVKASKTGPGEALDVTFNLEVEEFVKTFKTAYGLRVVLHDSGTRPFPSSEGVTISSGGETDIGVKLTHVKRLGGRYGSCHGTSDDTSPGHKYTLRSCRDQCVRSMMLERCRCVELGDETDGGDTQAGSVRLCSTRNDLKCISGVKEEHYTATNKGNDLCSCNNPCEEIVYTPTISSRVWPVLDQLTTLEEEVCRQNSASPKCTYLNQNFSAENLDRRRASFARIRLYYEHLNYEVMEEVPFYGIPEIPADCDGVLPWLPHDLTGLRRADWIQALRFETTFYCTDQKPLKPAQMDFNVMATRSLCLKTLAGNSECTESFEWTTSKLDRLLFTGMEFEHVDDEVDLLLEKVISRDTEVQAKLGAFGDSDPVTPSRWFRWLLKRVPKQLRSAAPTALTDYVFKQVAIMGSTANVRPSKLAAALLVTLLGDEEAEPYLCGYELFELYYLSDYLEHIINTFPRW